MPTHTAHPAHPENEYVQIDGSEYRLEQTEDGFNIGTRTRKGDDYQTIAHPGGFVAAFDITRVWGRDVWRDMMDEHGLEQSFWKPDFSDRLSGRYVWFNDDVVITTTTNPLTGENPTYEQADHYVPSQNHAKCGYIHIVGEEAVVKEIYNYIHQNANTKDHSLGYWCV